MSTFLVIKVEAPFFFLFVAGIGFCIVAYLFYRRATRFIRNGVKTKAKIIDVKIEQRGEWDDYYPTLQFTTLDDRQIRVEVSGHAWDHSTKGAVVDIVYDPENPRTVIDGYGHERIFEPCVYGLFGLALIYFSFGYFSF